MPRHMWLWILCILTFYVLWLSRAEANGTRDEASSDVLSAIYFLRPDIDEDRAALLATHFEVASQEEAIDPLLSLSIAFRESHLHEFVETLQERSSKGAIGLMQIMPRSAPLQKRPRKCRSTLRGSYCQIATGVRWLAYCRETCEGSTWQWVYAYGRSECPSLRRAKRDPATRYAYHIYTSIGGQQWI